MRKPFFVTIVVVMVVASASLVIANKQNEGDGYCITISPSTLVLSSPDTIVTVHSNIPYGSVDTASLTLGGIPATFTKADACGDLVVKFSREDVQGLVDPGSATLMLCGLLKDKDNTPFVVSDDITVKE